MAVSHTVRLHDLLRAVAACPEPGDARARMYQAFCEAFDPDDDVPALEAIFFSTGLDAASDEVKQLIIHQLVLVGTDEAFAVLARIVKDTSQLPGTKKQAAKSLLRLNHDVAWDIIGLSGPSWLDPLSVVTANPIDRLNGPGLTGGVPDDLFKHVELGAADIGYGRDPEDTEEP